MSTSQAEPLRRGPRWAHHYTARDLSIDDAAAKVSRATGLTFRQRQSSFVGRYFLYEDAEVEIHVKLNWVDDEDELVHPDLPEGVFVYYDSPDEDQLAAQLEAIPELEFLRKRPFG